MNSINEKYLVEHTTALGLLETIRGQVENMIAPEENSTRINWGHIGSLKYLNSELERLHQHLTHFND